MLDAWREQGAARLDPVRFHRLDALERRAAALDGDARAARRAARRAGRRIRAARRPHTGASRAGRAASACRARACLVARRAGRTRRAARARRAGGPARHRSRARRLFPRDLGEGPHRTAVPAIARPGPAQCGAAQFEQPRAPVAVDDARAVARVSAAVPLVCRRARVSRGSRRRRRAARQGRGAHEDDQAR
ncbi:hypothetical protein DN512_06110 [Burkholderia multivorans]|nr:hypothetical protein DN512_06110 [Burkholderia multivorans]